ncbi:hypothetical protein EFL90_02125 [Lactococcus lactis]|uniref:hypothetical protein n=1 Tax=Lactococcus lactis TaxID=1358 RepID=UPI00223B49C8|nr:hypothetical protein [Lactococcus lactis]MCT1193504.1 hypothetical protein [Lactococcus lactis]
MKKNFFMKTFNLTSKLLILSCISLFFSLSISFIWHHWGTIIKNFFPNNTEFYLLKIAEIFNNFLGAIIFLSLLLIIIEVVKRIIHDSLINYFKSIIQTLRLRRFLRQSESIKYTDEGKKSVSLNPVIENFNRSAQKSIVNVSNKKIIVFLHIPNTGQAQKILIDLESQIVREISSYNLDYYFSQPNRIKNQLWIVGTKRR